jgi:circadian clock protein KaiC
MVVAWDHRARCGEGRANEDGEDNMKREQTTRSLDRVRTGIPGFDDIMDGGLPRGGVTVVLGGPGAGKTIFGMQVLAKGAADHHEPGILVGFEESAARICANTAAFAWGGDRLEAEGVHVIDAQLSQSIEQGGEFDLVGLLAVLTAKAAQVGAKRIVFDGLDVLLAHLGQPALVRREVFRLRDWVHDSGLSAIVTAKADAAEARPSTDYDFLQFMADCVVTLHHRVVQGTALRFMRVAKYRGAAHSADELPLTISSSGIELAANTTIGLEYVASTERISSGIERLDAMLSGGYYRGSAVVITGAPGTARTTLAAAFAEAAAARGEHTIYVSFDESPDQIVRNVASIGISLGRHIKAGTLRVHSLRAGAESPETHVARIRSLLRQARPRNLVIDPLSALTLRGAVDDAEGAALQILDFAKTAGISVVSTALLGSQPLTDQKPLSVATAADVWMHVSYVDQGGERNRAITIIKARGTGHSNQVRELVLTSTGVTLADVYSVGGEVLMGTLRWEKENDARRTRAAAQSNAMLREQKAELALAETKARAVALAREQAIREAELQQIRADAAIDVGHRAGEADELLHRRRADPATLPPELDPDMDRLS